MEEPVQDPNEVNSLEGPAEGDTAGGSEPGSLSSEPAKPATPDPDKAKKKKGSLLQRLVTHINIYLLIFIFMVVIAGVVVVVGMQRNKKALETPTVTTQELTQEALDTISNSETKVGDPKQTLSIESNAIFAGKVLIRDSLDVAGTIKVGGALSLPGLTVAGTSNFDQLQANKLSIAGDTNVQGTLTVQKNIAVSGGATFGGPISAPQITAQSLQLNSDLSLTRHIDAGGPTPGRSNGTALGNGGTSSVSGTDTAGTLAINTGGAPGAGCFATVTFAVKFNSTPHVIITPVGSAAAGLNYYINRSTTEFSVCTTNPAPAGQNFAFDYIVID
jgi:cytoskeletal protein CcmA (bactofilin family)